jgi:hypothetical protein
VRLGIDTAQFSAGLKNSQANLAKFGKTVAIGFTAVAAAATAAGVAMGIAVKGAIDHADELGKVSQKIGISVEALSRLEYAAKLSDVELEGLTTGLRKFSQVVVQAAGNSKSGPAQVFSALGIAVKDAAGNLRSSDQLFADVADRFSQMKDGALKTSLAVQLFGKSGADLIPLLNSGRDGLKQMADESDRLGATISTKTAKAAEKFNDTLTTVGQILQGVVNKVMEAALPSLQSFADFLASPEFASAAQTFGTTLLTVLQAVAEAIVGVTNAARDLFNFLNSSAESSAPLLNDLLPGEKLNLADRVRSSSANPDTASSLYAGFNFGAGGQMNVAKPAATNSFAPVIAGAGAAKTAVTDLMAGINDAQPKVENFAKTIADSLATSFTSFADAVLSGVPAIEALSDVLGNLGKQLLNSAISQFFGGLFGGGGGLFKPAPKLGVDFGLGLFANGGITDRPAIFGDAGPEAAVPLPDGRSIPVTLSGATGGGGMTEVLIRLDQGMVAQILKQADNNAVQIVKSQAPAAVMQTQRNRG